MISNLGMTRQAIAIEQRNPRSRVSIWLLGFGIAVLFWLVVAFIATIPQANATQIADTSIAQQVWTWGNAEAGTQYTLSIFEGSGVELTWQSDEATPEDARQVGAWLTNRSGSLQLIRD